MAAEIEKSKRELESKVNLLMRVAQAAAQGDQSVVVGVHGEDDMGRLGEAFAKMMTDLKHVISEVVESANQFAEGRGSWPSAQLPQRVVAEPGGDGRGNVGFGRAAQQGDPRDQSQRLLCP